MKSMTKNILFSALVIFGAVSCVKDPFDESLGERISITLTAENPGFGDTKTKAFSADSAAVEGRIVYEDSSFFICAPQSMEPDTKTGMTTDGTPFWTPGDQIEVITASDSKFESSKFSTNLTGPTLRTDFTGKIKPNSDFAWAIYPYTGKLSASLVSNQTQASLEIPALQSADYPDSFAKTSDLLLSEKITFVAPPTEKSITVSFSRVVGFLKFLLYDNSKKRIEDPIVSMTIESSNKDLVGQMKFNLDTKQKVSGPNGKAVTVKYPMSTGSPSAVFSVFPQDLKGMTFNVKGKTQSGKEFQKENLTLPDQPYMNLQANRFIELRLQVDLTESTEVESASTTDAWENFMFYERHPNAPIADRVLLDYSYAGYHYGEKLPPDTDVKSTSGVNFYNIADEMDKLPQNLKDDAISDARQAFKACVDLHNGGTGKTVFYFPKSKSPYVLHNNYDNSANGTYTEKDSLGYNKSNPILISRGNFVIIGDGEKSVLKMANENLPDDKDLYSSPEMIIIKSPYKFNDKPISTPQAHVVSNAVRGSKTVVVDQAVTVGEWYCLYLHKKIGGKKNPQNFYDPSVVYDFEGHPAEPHMKEIIGSETSIGYLKVREFHKVDKCTPVDGQNGQYEVVFHEPIMRDVDIYREGEGNWQLRSFTPIEEIGIENIVFEGRAKTSFWHHNSWKDDGGYKPLQLTRVANSWMRNVTFRSVSECATFATSANCSAYNIKVTGNRGHSGVRAMTSTRIFLGNIVETSEGQFIPAGQKPEGESLPDAGQYHASGVSKPSIGTVLWRNHWGKDATFESHSSQPRATLVDCCKGGWVEWRFGGAQDKVPNHLRDLTIWNFYSERMYLRNGQSGNYLFWDHSGKNMRAGAKKESWRVAPPILVGFGGIAVPIFNTTLSSTNKPNGVHDGQLKYYEENFNDVDGNSTGSLYEAQLRQRINREGISPAWLNYLQTNKPTFK